MTNLIGELENKINACEKIIICRHIRPDFDALGSQLALQKLLQKKYENKNIIAYGSDDIEDFKFLGKNNQIPLIEFENALIITTDTANYERIEIPEQAIQKYNLEIIKIDHHPDVEKYGKINLVNSKASSTCEFIYKIFVEELNYSIDSEIARLLFTGIYGDTAGFSFPITSSYTFKVASELIKTNFDFENLILTIKEMDTDIIKMLGWIYQNIEISNNIGVLKLDKKVLAKLPVKANRISVLVNYLGIFKELRAWVFMIEYSKFIRVNLRSKGNINVSEIASNYDGGGHKNASGAKIYNWKDADLVLNELLEAVQKES